MFKKANVEKNAIANILKLMTNGVDSKITVDEILVQIALPIIMMDFESEKAKMQSYKPIYRVIESLVKKNPKFRRATKEQLIEVLPEKWINSLDEKAKKSFAMTFKLVSGFENDYALFDSKLYNVYLSNGYMEAADRVKFSDTPVDFSATSKPKKQVYSSVFEQVNHDTLKEKLAEYITWYRDNFEYLVSQEGYKWKAIKTFQTNYDEEAEDFASMLKAAFADTQNLLAGIQWTPKGIIIKYATHHPEETKTALTNLFDEGVALDTRIEEYKSAMQKIHDKCTADGIFTEKQKSTYQDDRAISVLLSLRYPDKHYIYQYTVYNDFVKKVGLIMLNSSDCKLVNYENFSQQLLEVICEDTELLELYAKFHDEQYGYHLMVQDFIYCLYCYLGKDKETEEANNEEAL